MLKEDAYVKVQASIYYQHYTLSGVQKMADCHVALIATDRKSRIIKGYQNTNT